MLIIENIENTHKQEKILNHYLNKRLPFSKIWYMDYQMFSGVYVCVCMCVYAT